MKKEYSSVILLILNIIKNKRLIFNLTKREISVRYKGSLFGVLWSFLTPILMLLIYTYVFSFIFNAKWGHGNSTKIEFALILFAGLMVFNLFSECILKSPSILLANVNYVKKVIFPLEILPIINILSAIFNSIVSMLVWISFYSYNVGIPHLTILLFPVILLPVVLLSLGLSWLFSALGVYLRDISQIVSIFVTALMFLSPIFYPITVIPDKYRLLLNINPLVPAISQYRDILYWGKLPSLIEYITYLSTCVLFAWLGFFFFQTMRKGFADVL